MRSSLATKCVRFNAAGCYERLRRVRGKVSISSVTSYDAMHRLVTRSRAASNPFVLRHFGAFLVEFDHRAVRVKDINGQSINSIVQVTVEFHAG
jgi:hypothetical protein